MVAEPIRPDARIRALVRERIAGEEEIHLSELTDAMVAVLEQDDEFLRAFAKLRLRDAVYEQVRLVVQRTRDLVLVGDVASTPEATEKRASHFADRFLRWMEHAGERHVQVMDMTRGDLLLAADERRQRGEHEIQVATLWARLADGLEGGQKVGERFTAEEIETMYQDIKGGQ